MLCDICVLPVMIDSFILLLLLSFPENMELLDWFVLLFWPDTNDWLVRLLLLSLPIIKL